MKFFYAHLFKPIALSIFFLAFGSSVHLHAQCPSGYAPATFEWAPDAPANTWTAADGDGTGKTYTITYTDSYGQTKTFDVTLTITDPNATNIDDDFTCNSSDGECDDGATGIDATSQTGGAYGNPYLTVGQSTGNSDQGLTYTFTFSEPIIMSNFVVGDIDYQGDNWAINNGGASTQISSNDIGYQDEVEFNASLGGTDVGLGITNGSATTLNGQTVTSIYNIGVNGNISPGAAAGTATVNSGSNEIDAFSFTYSNGPDDGGVSDGHAIRVSGFNICVKEVLPLATLSTTKTASPTGEAEFGDVLTYTIVVENTGSNDATNVTLDDVLPAGVTYVDGSAEKTYPSSLEGTITKTFSSESFGSSLSQTATITAGDLSDDGTTPIPADATITSYDYDLLFSTTDYLRDISVSGTYPTGTAFTLDPYNPTAGSGSNVPQSGSGTASGTAIGSYSLNWNDSETGFGGTNTVNSAEIIIGWSSSTTVTDAANAPGAMVAASDGITLKPGETMTVTYQVTVDSDASGTLTNTATADADNADPESDTADVEVATGSIGDTVWLDADGDGVVDAGEQGLAGATVILTPPAGVDLGNGDGVAITTTTDVSGNYIFNDLPAGDYTIAVDVSTVSNLPTGVTADELAETFDSDGGNDSTSDVTLAAGENKTDQDFGYRATGSIGDLLYVDFNGNGVYDDGVDLPIENITVTLDPGTPGDPSDDITTVTDSNGNYLFEGVLPDDYTLTVDTNDPDFPGGIVNTIDPDGTADNTTDVTVGAGTEDLTQYFGYSLPRDHGDLPNGYFDLYAMNYFDADGDDTPNNSGAVWLGNIVNYETEQWFSTDATGDGLEEDGLAIEQGGAGDEVTWKVTVNGASSGTTVYFTLYIDWTTNDGLNTFDVAISGSGVTGSPTVVDVPVTIPSDYEDGTVNVRLVAASSETDAELNTGGFLNGEIEDYQFAANQILPVELIYFEAEADNIDAVLTWATASEQNSSHFEVERSVNGVDFDTVERADAVGESQNNVNYSYIDKSAVSWSDLVYYRLKQVDHNGAESYSPVEIVRFGAQALSIKLYPNPVRENLIVSANGYANVTVGIYDLLGKRVLESNDRHIDMSSLKSSIYIVRVLDRQGKVLHSSRITKVEN